MKPEVISSTLNKMAKHKHLRKLLAGRIDDYIYKGLVNDQSDDLKQVQVKRYQYLSAMLHCMIRNIDKGYVSRRILNKIIDVLVQNNLVRADQSYEQAVEKYKEKYGELPPSFIVFSRHTCTLRRRLREPYRPKTRPRHIQKDPQGP